MTLPGAETLFIDSYYALKHYYDSTAVKTVNDWYPRYKPEGEAMALTTDGKTLSPAFQSIYDQGAVDLTTDEEKSKWALFLSFYDTLQQKPENKSEALAFAAAKLAERYTAGETDFYGVDLSMMIRELGRLSVAVMTAVEADLKQAGA